MGLRVVRHREPPPMRGCRWCGFVAEEHDIQLGVFTVRGRGEHEYTPPTETQQGARFLAKAFASRVTIGELSSVASASALAKESYSDLRTGNGGTT